MKRNVMSSVQPDWINRAMTEQSKRAAENPSPYTQPENEQGWSYRLRRGQTPGRKQR